MNDVFTDGYLFQPIRSKQHHERWQDAVDLRVELPVYIPSSDIVGIADRSGIVGITNPEAERLVVYYEGWVHGAMQYAALDRRGQWEAAVLHAAGRAITAYPTVATRMVDRHDLYQVGTFHVATNAITLTDDGAVTTWLA